jgi:hypothetical protein
MAHAGQELEGFGGFRLRIVRIEPDELELDASYPGGAPLPPAHLHPSQDERFEVLEGAVRAIVDGAERRYAAGEAFDVPAGTPHQMAGDGPARVRWLVRPALRTAEFFEGLYGGRAAREGLAFLEEYADEIRLAPQPDP